MISAPELVILAVIAFILGLPVYGIVDAARRSDTDFARVGSNRTLWLVLQVIGGAFAAVIYFAAVRPRVRAARTPI